MPPNEPADVLMTMPTSDALRQAEILAMRSLSDNMGILTRSVERLSADMREVRDKVIAFEAQELKEVIGGLRTDLLDAVKALRSDHEKRLDALERELPEAIDGLRADHVKKIDTLKDQHVGLSERFAKFQGVFLPLGVLAASLLSGALAFLTQFAMRGIHP